MLLPDGGHWKRAQGRWRRQACSIDAQMVSSIREDQIFEVQFNRVVYVERVACLMKSSSMPD